jgi:chromosome partitioning protein
MTRIIGIVNLKGGVGKTTTCVNLGAALALYGLRILLIDLDPQKSLTGWANIDHQPSAGDVLAGRAELAPAIVRWEKTGCWVLPAGQGLRSVETHLSSFTQPEYILKYKLKTLNEYDYVLIDNSPSYGLLNINTICASDEIIIPLQTEILSLESSVPFFETLGEIRRKYHPGLKIAGILANMFDSRTNLSRSILEQMRASEHLGPLMFKTFIRKNVKLAETPSLGCAVTRYSTAHGTEDYKALAEEILTESDRAKIASIDRNSIDSHNKDQVVSERPEQAADNNELDLNESQLIGATKNDDDFS